MKRLLFWTLLCFFLAGLSGHLAAEADDQPAKTGAIEPGFQSIFNGKDLQGWEGNLELWKVRDGMIVGDSSGIPQNEFLATKKQYGDFELRLEFKLHGGKGNSGVQFRTQRVPKSSEVEGYQADIGENYWGCLYDEHRRRKVLAAAGPELKDVLKKDDWNEYIIRARGNHIVLKINGVTTVDYHEQDSQIPRSGIIAIQVHSGPPLRVDFRNLRIRELNERK
jgi:hypothetical protein